MHVGIDCSCWQNPRGFGRFTRGLVPALLAHSDAHTFTCFVDRTPPPELSGLAQQVVCVAPGRPVVAATVEASRRSLADIAAFSRATLAHPTDVFLFPAVYSWFPLPPRRRSVVTVHDAIAEQFPALVFPQRRARALWAAKMRLALWQATRVLTVSASARRDIVRHLGVSPLRIDVTSEGADATFRPERDPAALAHARSLARIPPHVRYLLYVGGLAPHKNLPGWLRGFERALAHAGLEDLQLVIVGDPLGGGFYSCADEIRRIVDASDVLRHRVVFSGFVADAALPALYSGALAVAMPSFSEGFGLPALEALACGTPVLASTAGALPEIVGDAGLLFDPRDPATIASAIVSIAATPGLVERLRARTAARAREYSWDRAAVSTLVSLERAAARP